jgi:diguanylate cyclase (GGDEF)-like protein/putative nucleotidyltransferase with HDIG domain
VGGSARILGMSVGMARPLGAKVFIGALAALAAGCCVYASLHWQSTDPFKFFCYLAVALLASSLKIKLPGVNGTMSVNFLFILLGVLELSFAETLVIGFAAVFAQCYPRSSNLKPIHVIFNLSQLPVGTAIAYGVFRLVSAHFNGPLVLALVAMSYFVFNTLVMSVIIWLTEARPILKVWSECYFWSFPYYLVGAAIVGLVSFLNRHVGWQSSLLVLPPVYLIYRSYRLYLGKLEDEKRHAEKVSSLHLKTIEALALAIEAKDHTTHDHLQRVRVYAMELARDLKLSEDETEALEAASVLHDIGKLAVPEHIISKPGKLTPDEFEKMKVHPIVGAEILEQVEFPYPVVPIVRAHHEKWDGSGYPAGLKGEEIPIGARILAAVDCLDALATDRQYRRGLPLHEAMAKVAAEAGKSFDPRVVAILQERYVELERMAHEKPVTTPVKLSTDVKVERGLAPAAGFAESPVGSVKATESRIDNTNTFAKAREESQSLFDLVVSRDSAVSLNDMFSLLATRLRALMPYEAMAVYLKQGDVLVAGHVNGDNYRLFSSLKIPVGEGLSGWVAQNSKPILNGNPSVEPGYLNDPTKYSTLCSALAVPVQGVSGIVGVVAVYRAQADGFSREDLRTLQAVASKMGFAIEAGRKGEAAGFPIEGDDASGLPRLGALYGHLERAIAECKEADTSLGLFVVDLEDLIAIGNMEEEHLLRTFAAGLKDCCRGRDFAARAGRHEFAVVVKGLGPDGTSAILQRLQAVATSAAKAAGSGSVAAVSTSHASCPADGTTVEQLLEAADRRRYAAKQTRTVNRDETHSAAKSAQAGT